MTAKTGFDDARAFWDERFAAPGYIFGRDPNRFLTSHANLFRPGAAVLDVATGEGRNAVWLARLGCDVTGIDISPVAIAKAQRLAAEADVHARFEVGDLRRFAWAPNAFDAVVTIFIQFAAPDEREAVFAGMRQTLRAGGVLVLQGYTPKQLDYRTGGPPRAEHMYTEPMLRDAFAGWEILHLQEHEDVLNEGTKHVGRSALIDLVARKS
jgi:SAM-dependent methyltransferase